MGARYEVGQVWRRDDEDGSVWFRRIVEVKPDGGAVAACMGGDLDGVPLAWGPMPADGWRLVGFARAATSPPRIGDRVVMHDGALLGRSGKVVSRDGHMATVVLDSTGAYTVLDDKAIAETCAALALEPSPHERWLMRDRARAACPLPVHRETVDGGFVMECVVRAHVGADGWRWWAVDASVSFGEWRWDHTSERDERADVGPADVLERALPELRAAWAADRADEIARAEALRGSA